MQPIPLVDLAIQERALAEDIARRFRQVLERTAFVLGAEVATFEEEFASYTGIRHCVGVANGTDALELALRAAGVGEGDEVLLPANTFIATAAAVVRAGARPVLVDSVAETHLIDVSKLSDAVTTRTRAVLPVHLYGQLAPMEDVLRIAAEHDVLVIEDAAQSQGATRNGTSAGGFGLAAGTSFYPGKNLGAYGDAGAVLTNDADVARRVRSLRNHGSEVKYEHAELGFNSRLDTLQAAVLSAKLQHLDEWNAQRREAANRYQLLLADLADVQTPRTLPGNEHVWHLYVISVPRRDEVIRSLQAAGIGAAIHYPIPVHLQGAFGFLGHQRGDFPVAEAAARSILSLPIFPGITASQQERVVGELQRALP